MAVVRCVDYQKRDCTGWCPPPGERNDAREVRVPRNPQTDFLWVVRGHGVVDVLLRDHADDDVVSTVADQRELFAVIERERRGEFCDQLLCQRYHARQASASAKTAAKAVRRVMESGADLEGWMVTLSIPPTMLASDAAQGFQWLVDVVPDFLKQHAVGSAWRFEFSGRRQSTGVRWRPHVHAILLVPRGTSMEAIPGAWLSRVQATYDAQQTNAKIRNLVHVQRVGVGPYAGDGLDEHAERILRYIGKSILRRRQKRYEHVPTPADLVHLWLEVEWHLRYDSGRLKRPRRLIWCGRTGLLLDRQRRPAA